MIVLACWGLPYLNGTKRIQTCVLKKIRSLCCYGCERKWFRVRSGCRATSEWNAPGPNDFLTEISISAGVYSPSWCISILLRLASRKMLIISSLFAKTNMLTIVDNWLLCRWKTLTCAGNGGMGWCLMLIVDAHIIVRTSTVPCSSYCQQSTYWEHQWDEHIDYICWIYIPNVDGITSICLMIRKQLFRHRRLWRTIIPPCPGGPSARRNKRPWPRPCGPWRSPMPERTTDSVVAIGSAAGDP